MYHHCIGLVGGGKLGGGEQRLSLVHGVNGGRNGGGGGGGLIYMLGWQSQVVH